MTDHLPALASLDSSPKFLLVGDPYTLLLTGQQTNGAFALIHATCAPGFGPPPHSHAHEDETFYVLSGQITYFLGDKPHVLNAGSALFIPKNTPHFFKNSGNTTASFLVQIVPAGNFDRYLQTVGEPLPPNYIHAKPQPPSPQHLQKVLSHGPQFGITFL